MKKAIILLIINSFLLACDNTPNKYQNKIVFDNMGCYKSMVNEIRNNDLLQRKIKNQRDKKIRGLSDPMTVKKNYRLIAFEEIDSLFSKKWKEDCHSKIKSSNSLKGIRFIDKNSIILQANKFYRPTIGTTERYSRTKTIETHRVIFSTQKLDDKAYQFRNEKLIWSKKIDDNLFYNIYHFKY